MVQSETNNIKIKNQRVSKSIEDERSMVPFKTKDR